MNKTQKVILNDDNIDQDKYIFVKLEQDIKTLEILSLQIDQKDIYQSFNADYGVLVGQVISNNGIGIPNAKISIFIPLSDTDALNPDITSIYPYTSPTDKNTEGKRYNLLPRAASFNSETGTYKPKQPFGSFPLKEEMMVNETILDVYKSYYKYTCTSNSYGHYMMYGIPTGTQTVSLSVDITDIGQYSMTPASMITNLGYSTNLFTDNNTKIKSSTDLNDLPNIETQDLAINVISFWGDSSNNGFDIGITRQDFKIKAKVSGFFTIFGSALSMGRLASLGNPNRSVGTIPVSQSFDDGFYYWGDNQDNASDIRTFRTGFAPTIRVFSYNTNLSIDIITGNTTNLDFTKDIIEIPKDDYSEFNDGGGDFVLTGIACNRRKVVIDNSGNESIVDDNSSYGIFTRFYGMVVFESPELPLNISYSEIFANANTTELNNKTFFKIPQSLGLLAESAPNQNVNNAWRKEYFEFKPGIYSVAQFWPTKKLTRLFNIDTIPNSTNILSGDTNYIGGMFVKVAGSNKVTQTDIDTLNYIVNPDVTGSTFTYDMASNAFDLNNNQLFGAQWLNGCVTFVNPVFSGHDANPLRKQISSDMIFEDYQNGVNYNMRDNKQIIFATLTNTKNWLTSSANQFTFIELPSSEIAKLSNTSKGVNITLYNQSVDPFLKINPSYFKYREPTPLSVSNGRGYNSSAWDINYNRYYPLTGDTASAYFFKGMYGNNNIDRLTALNII